MKLLTAIPTWFTALLCCHAIACQAAGPNVLLIAIDDLNDWVGCLDGHPNASTPNIDRLASRGTLFTNAHCQAPICNPSRASIMYGLRPSSTGVYMNSPKPWTVKTLQNSTTMPRWFARHGYVTYTTGKIYHGSALPDGDFDIVGPRPGQRLKLDQRIIPPSPNGAKGLWDFGAQTYDESEFQDHITASWAIEKLNSHDSASPFFMAIGFYRPHVPLYAPERIVKQIPLKTVSLPIVKDGDRDDLPPIASSEMTAFVAPDHAWFVESGNWIKAVQAYLACVRWTDEQVGRLLDALDDTVHADNTVIVLYSDHGFFLGEKERWAKQSLWERATRVPFVVAAPGLPRGQRCDQPVELLSIYPTLTELTEIPANATLEGRSLTGLLRDADTTWPHAALTTHGRNNHSVRTKQFRYIRYHDGTEELYDHANDHHEWKNLATADRRPAHAALIDQLSAHIPSRNAPSAAAGKKKRKNSR